MQSGEIQGRLSKIPVKNQSKFDKGWEVFNGVGGRTGGQTYCMDGLNQLPNKQGYAFKLCNDGGVGPRSGWEPGGSKKDREDCPKRRVKETTPEDTEEKLLTQG